jgi:alginate O-acetyltransferase complex protein AlgI
VTFDLETITILCLGALAYSIAIPARLRGWALLVGSLIAIYWLQPPLIIRYSDYILPTLTLALTVLTWWVTRKPNDEEQQQFHREDIITLAVIALVVLGVAATRYLQADFQLTTRPPDPLRVLLVVGGVGAVLMGISSAASRASHRRTITGVILLIIGVFIVLKTETLALEIIGLWRTQTGRSADLASVGDLAWLGFSYVAFRLIHTLRDRQTGRLPALSLREFTTYVIFFPAYIAGPIDRAERFVKDFRTLPDHSGLDATRITEGLTRIGAGIFKKFVIADSLALGASLNATNALQADSTFGLWLLLYGYALRLFFDFSGYTDIAIGIGILLGVKLPENFDRPYLKTNITSFWQSWHITLSNWARFYVFTPLSRLLLTRQPKPSPVIVVLSAQLATMITIGLWHGVTWNFLIWGLWHGVGLFIHKRWSDRTRRWYRGLNDQPAQKRAWSVTGWFITFHFVVLGWVWFALPDFNLAVDVFGKLFGV